MPGEAIVDVEGVERFGPLEAVGVKAASELQITGELAVRFIVYWAKPPSETKGTILLYSQRRKTTMAVPFTVHEVDGDTPWRTCH